MEKKPYIKHWPRKNLGELLNFIDRRHPEGYSLHTLAADFGMSEQYISQIMRKDDTTLSKAERIAACYGCTLKLFFPQREHICSDSPWARPFPNAGNLAGLAKYIADSNISVNYMSQRIGKSNNVLTSAFNKGDIMISTLYTVARNLNIEFLWIFEKDGEEI